MVAQDATRACRLAKDNSKLSAIITRLRAELEDPRKGYLLREDVEREILVRAEQLRMDRIRDAFDAGAESARKLIIERAGAEHRITSAKIKAIDFRNLEGRP